MFEKEAEEWAKETMDCVKTENCLNQDCNYFSDEERIIAKSAFEDGAEFGYNKANEWHFVKDEDLPEDEDYKLCISFNGSYYIARYEELFVSWTNQEHKEVCCPYAWKEIVLPKESE